ncbi:MAG: class I SAM-dependent methyltransferase [Chloroflexota bacterium]
MTDEIERTSLDFIKNLTGVTASEIQAYFTEIESNREFNHLFAENRSNAHGRQFYSWSMNIGTTLGTVLYTLCRIQKPDAVVETGVASGVSSAYILCALQENGHGELYSIDLTWEETARYPGRSLHSAPDGASWERQGERQSGWIIPDYLRHRWHLIQGKSSEKLPPLLEELGTIDIFLHDSEHSYRNMLREYRTAWAHLKAGGILLSHNIDMTDAFSDFCRSAGQEGFRLTNMGAAVKI